MVGIQSTIGNLCRLIAIINLFNKDGSIIAFLLNLVSHALFIHDTPKIVLSVHAHHVLPASHIFVDSIIVFASQIHRSSDIQETRNHVSLASTVSRRIGCKLLSQALIRREEESFCLHLVFKPHDKADTFLLLKGVELGTSAMPNHHRFTILIHHLGSILRFILPITEPVLEVGSTDGCPLFCIQFGLLTIRSSHIGSVCLGISNNLLLLCFQRESDIVATIYSIHSNLLPILSISTLIAAHINASLLQGIHHIAWSIARNDSLFKLIESVRSHKLGFKIEHLIVFLDCIKQLIVSIHPLIRYLNIISLLQILLFFSLMVSKFNHTRNTAIIKRISVI